MIVARASGAARDFAASTLSKGRGDCAALGRRLHPEQPPTLRQTERRPPPAVYVSTAIPYALETWQLYLAKAHRDDLWPRTHKFDATVDVSLMPSSSVVVEPLIEGRVIDAPASSPTSYVGRCGRQF